MADNGLFTQVELEATVFTGKQLLDQFGHTERAGVPQIALAGRSNVGKSSLLNALACRKKLAKVSSTPGKTRSVNFYRVTPGDFYLVDLPGYGYAKCSHEEQKAWIGLIERYLADCVDLKALALLLDCRLPPQPADRELAEFALGHDMPLLPILTKTDKCSRNEQGKRQQEWSRLLGGLLPLPVSSLKNSGLDELRAELRRFAGQDVETTA